MRLDSRQLQCAQSMQQQPTIQCRQLHNAYIHLNHDDMPVRSMHDFNYYNPLQSVSWFMRKFVSGISAVGHVHSA
jgi:hypothetical protein